MSDKQNCESDVRYKQKAVIEFLMCEGKKPKKIHECLKVVYGEHVFHVSTVCYWTYKVKKKLELLDLDHLGCPKL